MCTSNGLARAYLGANSITAVINFSFCYCAVLFDAEGQEAVQQHEEVRQRIFVSRAIEGNAVLNEAAQVIFVLLAFAANYKFPLQGPERPREDMRGFCN